MLLSEITPFVRYAGQFSYVPEKSRLTTRDCRLFYIIKGEGSVTINNKRYFYAPETVLLWQNGTEYKFNTDKWTEIIVVNFDYTLDNSAQTSPLPMIRLNRAENTYAAKQIFFSDCILLNQPLVVKTAYGVSGVLKEIVKEMSTRPPHYNAKASALLKKVVVDVIRQSEQSVSSAKIMKKLDKVIQYIHQNYDKEIDNTVLADLVGYHPYYLNRIMKQINGITLHRYLVNYRLSVAQQLLVSTDEPVSDIAMQTGFQNATVFTQKFKEANGITPLAFRKRAK